MKNSPTYANIDFVRGKEAHIFNIKINNAKLKHAPELLQIVYVYSTYTRKRWYKEYMYNDGTHTHTLTLFKKLWFSRVSCHASLGPPEVYFFI